MFTVCGRKAAFACILLVCFVESNISFKFPSQDASSNSPAIIPSEKHFKTRVDYKLSDTTETTNYRSADLFQEVPTIQNSIDGWRVYGVNADDSNALDYKKNRNLYKADDLRWVSENWKNIQTSKNKNILMEVLNEKNRNISSNKTADNPKGFQNDILDMLGKSKYLCFKYY